MRSPLFEVDLVALESSEDAVMAVEPSGVITFTNSAFTRITGWKRDEVVGRPSQSFTAAIGAAEVPLFCTGTSFRRPDNSPFPIQSTVMPLGGGGQIMVFRDLTGCRVQQGIERGQAKSVLSTAETLHSIVHATDLVALIVTGADLVVTLFNPGAERMLGYTAEEIVGKTTPKLFHVPEEVEGLRLRLGEQLGYEISREQVFRSLARYGSHETNEFTFIRKDGSRLPVTLGVTTIRDSRGEITGYLGIALDITRLKAAQTALDAARRVAEEANRAKSEFLATMSHEIRTPMNGVLGMADLLLADELGPRQRKKVETLRDSAESLLHILNDILDFSKIEAHKLELERAGFDLRRLVEGVIDLMAAKAFEKKLELVCLIDPDVPTSLWGDPTRVRQVLLNLVGNAIKFTEKGHVFLRVSREAELAGETGDTGRPSVRFEVRDSGIGVAPEKQHLLFERFSQADASTTRKFGGTGLGLSIVRGLVEAMGGRTGFSSELGRGSTFWFTAALPAQAEVRRPRALSLLGKRILVIDDNAASREMLMQLMAFWQCAAEDADSAHAALDRLNRPDLPPFDAILLDLEMPEQSGEELNQAIRAIPRLACVPRILMATASRLAEGETGDCAEKIGKPVKQGPLGSALASALGLVRRPALADGTIQRPETPRQNRRHTRLLVVEDNPVNQEVMLGMLRHLGFEADLAGDGPAALELLGETQYSAILMDCQLPGMDGYELCRIVRDPGKSPGNLQTPVIAVTANARAEDREGCLAAGMDDYLAKPISMATLMDVLERWTGDPDTTHVTPHPGPTASVEASSPPADVAVRFHPEELMERVMGDNDLAQKVVSAFIGDMPVQLMSLARALEERDARALFTTAHTIKGSAALVGDPAIRDLAADLERMGKAGEVSLAAPVLSKLSTAFESLQPDLRRFCGICMEGREN